MTAHCWGSLFEHHVEHDIMCVHVHISYSMLITNVSQSTVLVPSFVMSHMDCLAYCFRANADNHSLLFRFEYCQSECA